MHGSVDLHDLVISTLCTMDVVGKQGEKNVIKDFSSRFFAENGNIKLKKICVNAVTIAYITSVEFILSY